MIKFPSLNSIKEFFRNTIGIWLLTIIVIVAIVCSAPTKADHEAEIYEGCYALGMVAYDSVINSRLEVPPETAMGILGGAEADAMMGLEEKKMFMRVILGAYLWQDDAHSYAMATYNDCLENGM